MDQTLVRRLVIIVLALSTALCVPLRPLWVDEIFQLEATWNQPFGNIVHSSMTAPGGMPLGYFAQAALLKITGFSTTAARIPALFFGLASVAVTAFIARRLRLNPTLAAALSLLTPLLFRYSTEARPYSQGLFFSCLSTALFLELRRAPSKAWWAAYFLCCVAAVYSQPFALFAPLAHAAYALVLERRILLPIISAIGLAGFSYLPWFLRSQAALQHEEWPHQMFFSWHQISPLMVVREISGGGYVCSVSLLLLVIVAFCKERQPLLLTWAGVPLVLAIVADAKFNYFFAIRQLIFVLPPLLLTATAGLEVLLRERKQVGLFLVSLYLVGSLVKDVRWQADGKEDWRKAAAELQHELVQRDECLVIEPAGDAIHYYFFEPGLRSRVCQPQGDRAPRLVAVSPYAPPERRKEASGGLNIGNTLILR